MSSAPAQSTPITVHRPTSLAVLQDAPTSLNCIKRCLANPGDGTCNTSAELCQYTGIGRRRQYSVLDQFGDAFNSVGLSAANATEEVPVTTTCPDAYPSTSSATTSVFFDNVGPLCSSCCLPGGPGCSFQTNPTQIIAVNGIGVGAYTITMSCGGVNISP